MALASEWLCSSIPNDTYHGNHCVVLLGRTLRRNRVDKTLQIRLESVGNWGSD